MIDFDSISIRAGLFDIDRLENRIHNTFIFTFFCVVSLVSFFLFA